MTQATNNTSIPPMTTTTGQTPASHAPSGDMRPASDGKRDWQGNVIDRPICTCGREMRWDGDDCRYVCAAEGSGNA